jgi:hypothetical protein
VLMRKPLCQRHSHSRLLAKSSFQRGSAQLQNGKWTIRYLVRDPSSPKGWKHKRETLPDCKSERQAQRVLSERLAGVNSFNNRSKKSTLPYPCLASLSG